MASADEKAVGLVPDNTSLDGYVGFTSAPNTFGYGINSAPPAGEYYFVGVVEHEFTEVMGRTSDLDFSGAYSLMDLFRYAGMCVNSAPAAPPISRSIMVQQTSIIGTILRPAIPAIWATGRQAPETMPSTTTATPE
jgi:hypothetical protein